MRCLVTGCAGFIGSNLTDRLLANGHEVVGYDNFSTGRRANLAFPDKQNFRFIEGDIRHLETCRKACGEAELVLHQAALGSVPRSIDDPIATTDNNVGALTFATGGENTFDAAGRATSTTDAT